MVEYFEERKCESCYSQFTECRPVETWESSITLYAGREPVDGRETDNTKEIPELGKTVGVRLPSSNLLYLGSTSADALPLSHTYTYTCIDPNRRQLPNAAIITHARACI